MIPTLNIVFQAAITMNSCDFFEAMNEDESLLHDLFEEIIDAICKHCTLGFVFSGHNTSDIYAWSSAFISESPFATVNFPNTTFWKPQGQLWSDLRTVSSVSSDWPFLPSSYQLKQFRHKIVKIFCTIELFDVTNE